MHKYVALYSTDLKYKLWSGIAEFHNFQKVSIETNSAENFQAYIVYERWTDSFLTRWYVKKD